MPESKGMAVGVQSLDRAISLLKLVATAYKDGMRLIELVDASGLPQPTVHRLLKQLSAGGLLTQDRARKYRLGHFAYELGLVASSQYGLKELCTPFVASIAQETGDTAFLCVPSGEDAFCIERCEGVYPIKVLPVEVGHRRPLGIGGSGLALLAFLPPADRERVLEKIAPRLASFSGLNLDLLRAHIERTQADGYAVISNYAVAGVTSIGHPLFDRYGSVIAAMSVSGVASRMDGARRMMIVACLRKACEALQAKLYRLPLDSIQGGQRG